MTRIARLAFLLALTSAAALPPNLDGQIPVVLQGRVEDASTRQPIEGARVLSADSSVRVLTDASGEFAIQLPSDASLALHVERIGYLAQRFDLPRDALTRVSVLLLEPQAIELPGVTVVAEAAIDVLLNNLERRRNAYPHAMRAFDRVWLDRFAPLGTVYDLIRQQIPETFPCPDDAGHLCRRGRARSFRNPFPVVRLTVCVDGRLSIDPVGELGMISTESVALVELYRRNGVKVYTADWILSRARYNWVAVMPDPPGGIAC